GHLRHESGHYIWSLLVQGQHLARFRKIFGDERHDYAEALREHYAKPPATIPDAGYISAYAASHPWEDFAETWAHYLHIVDTLEMVSEFGMEVRPKVDRDGELSTRIRFNPYEARDVQAIVDAWLPFTFAINSVNRAMGLRDLYPFI